MKTKRYKFLAYSTSQENVSDGDFSNIKMDWRQTSNTITLFYQTVRDYPGVSYQLNRISDSKLIFKLFFEKDIITHQLELTAEIKWPPMCSRNFDTMEVMYFSIAFLLNKNLRFKINNSILLLSFVGRFYIYEAEERDMEISR